MTNKMMRERGFEPLQALSYDGLNVARLTAPALPHAYYRKEEVLKGIPYDTNQFKLSF